MQDDIKFSEDSEGSESHSADAAHDERLIIDPDMSYDLWFFLSQVVYSGEPAAGKGLVKFGYMQHIELTSVVLQESNIIEVATAKNLLARMRIGLLGQKGEEETPTPTLDTDDPGETDKKLGSQSIYVTMMSQYVFFIAEKQSYNFKFGREKIFDEQAKAKEADPRRNKRTRADNDEFENVYSGIQLKDLRNHYRDHVTQSRQVPYPDFSNVATQSAAKTAMQAFCENKHSKMFQLLGVVRLHEIKQLKVHDTKEPAVTFYWDSNLFKGDFRGIVKILFPGDMER